MLNLILSRLGIVRPAPQNSANRGPAYEPELWILHAR